MDSAFHFSGLLGSSDLLGFSIHDLDLNLRVWVGKLGWPTEPTLRLILAAMLGGAVGLEREVRGRQAGFRTNLLVCLGSGLAMVVSVAFAHYDWPNPSGYNITLDPARVAYGVMGGIGFLGAGVIVKHGEAVRGLTTAAGMWCVAAIGLACGLGLYLIAIASTALVVLALWYLDYLEKWLPKIRYRMIMVKRAWHPGVVRDTVKLVEAGESRIDVKDATWERIGDMSEVLIRLKIAFANKREFFKFEKELDGYQDVQVVASYSDGAEAPGSKV